MNGPVSMLGQPLLKLMQQGLVLLLIVGCTILTPHENFVQHHLANVGQTIEALRPAGYARDVIDVTSLPNGNIAYRYRYVRSCRYIYEVDPKTNIIVAARWEGSEKDCVIAP